jgi:hypothetical protein
VEGGFSSRVQNQVVLQGLEKITEIPRESIKIDTWHICQEEVN